MFIEDRGKREWRLYDQSYTPLIAEQTSLHEEDMNYPFISYNKEDAVVYFFDNEEVIHVPGP